MKTIAVGKHGKTFTIDDSDFLSVMQYTWCVRPRSDRKKFYVYRYIRLGPKQYDKQYLHHFLMNPPVGIRVDHRDGNGLNNRRSNLRLATQQENSFNQTPHTDAMSKYKGVSFSGLIHGKYIPTKPWRARIRHNGKLIGLGWYVTELEAAVAYNAKAVELFGQFALLNEFDDAELEMIA